MPTDEVLSTPAEPSNDSYPLVGQVIGDRYRVIELIGTGGMGAVYRAEHVHMRQSVALKVLHREMTALPEVVARFEREAIAAGRIEHPNVAQARDFGRVDPDGSFYLVLEYVEGKVLGDVLEGGPFSVERTLSVAGQIAEALQAAHDKEIVHRDLKPDNVMLVQAEDGPELVKVLDFGIAKVDVSERGGSDHPITQIGTVFGTPEYMSPEQASGQPVDLRGDLYSLGLMMYRMLAGRPAFTGDDVNAVLMQQITQEAEPLPDSISAGVRGLVTDLLKKDPSERPESTKLVVDRILGLVGDPIPTTSRTRARVASAAWVETRPTLADRLRAKAPRTISVLGYQFSLGAVAGMLAALVLALTGVAWLASGSEPTSTDPVTSAATAPTSQPKASDPELDKTVANAFLGDPAAVAELERQPAASRTVRQWLALGRGRAKLGRPTLAMAAYRTALEQDADVAKDPALRRDVWAATKHPKAAELALRVAAEHLGAPGADMLYKVWVDTKQVTPATRLAKRLVYSPSVRSHASPALSLLLDWREADGCDGYPDLLRRTTVAGDFRALVLLARLKTSESCEVAKETLDAAISAVRDRPEPAPY